MATSTIDLHLPYTTRVDNALGNRHLRKVALERHGAHGRASAWRR